MKEEGFYGLERETWLCDYSQKITEVDKKKEYSLTEMLFQSPFL